MARTLTRPQREAIALMRECAGHDDGWAVICANSAVPSFKTDGQAWIHWRVAESLVRLDLAEQGDFGLIRLLEEEPPRG